MWKHLLHTIKYIKNLKIEEHANNGELEAHSQLLLQSLIIGYIIQ